MFSIDRYLLSSVEELRLLVRENPNSVSLRFYLGLKLLDEDWFELAKKEFESALALDPENVDAVLHLGIANFRLDHLLEASKAFRQVPDKHSLSHIRWEYLGEIHRKWKEYELARDCYFEALRSGGHSSVVVHRGLTELSLVGTKNLGFELRGRPLTTDGFFMEYYGRKVYATLRIFQNLCDPGRKVVLFSSDSGHLQRDPEDCGVTNAAEMLIQNVLERKVLGVNASDTFFFMHEDGITGICVMDLTRVSFELGKRAKPSLNFKQRILSFFSEPNVVELPFDCVTNLKFHQTSPLYFELLCGYRFFWKPPI